MRKSLTISGTVTSPFSPGEIRKIIHDLINGTIEGPANYRGKPGEHYFLLLCYRGRYVTKISGKISPGQSGSVLELRCAPYPHPVYFIAVVSAIFIYMLTNTRDDGSGKQIFLLILGLFFTLAILLIPSRIRLLRDYEFLRSKLRLQSTRASSSAPARNL